MKKMKESMRKIIVKGAEKMAKIEINTTCSFVSYQQEIPKVVKRMNEKSDEQKSL